jgi:thioredoxin 1
MAGKVLEVNDGNFVDFWAEWCGPCRAIAPYIDGLATEYEGKVKVVKLNIDHCPDTAVQYRIQAIPTLIAFNNGELVNQLRGPNKQQISSLFETISS